MNRQGKNLMILRMNPTVKKRISILLLLGAILGEMMGLSIAFLTEDKPYLFFTNMGNSFYLLCAIVVLICQCHALKKGKELAKWASLLHYVGTVTETLIFLIVVLYLVWFSGPMMLYSGSFAFLHLLCPLLAIANHFFFLGKPSYIYKEGALGFLPPLLYACAIIPLCACKAIEAPYPFLDFASNPPWLTLIYAIGSIIVLSLICFLLLRFGKKTQNLTEKDR